MILLCAVQAKKQQSFMKYYYEIIIISMKNQDLNQLVTINWQNLSMSFQKMLHRNNHIYSLVR